MPESSNHDTYLIDFRWSKYYFISKRSRHLYKWLKVFSFQIIRKQNQIAYNNHRTTHHIIIYRVWISFPTTRYKNYDHIIYLWKIDWYSTIGHDERHDDLLLLIIRNRNWLSLFFPGDQDWERHDHRYIPDKSVFRLDFGSYYFAQSLKLIWNHFKEYIKYI